MTQAHLSAVSTNQKQLLHSVLSGDTACRQLLMAIIELQFELEVKIGVNLRLPGLCRLA